MAGRLSRLEASGDEVRGIDLLFRRANGGKTFCARRRGRATPKGRRWSVTLHPFLHARAFSPGYQAIAFTRSRRRKKTAVTLGDHESALQARLVVLSAANRTGRAERGEGSRGLPGR